MGSESDDQVAARPTGSVRSAIGGFMVATVGIVGGMMMTRFGVDTSPLTGKVVPTASASATPEDAMMDFPAIPDTDALDRALDALAGSTARDCGRAELYQPAQQQALDGCVRQAMESNEPFKARHELRGIDSRVSTGVVRTRSGQVFLISYDSAPAGNGFDASAERFWIELCRDPVFSGGPQVLTCSPTPTPPSLSR